MNLNLKRKAKTYNNYILPTFYIFGSFADISTRVCFHVVSSLCKKKESPFFDYFGSIKLTLMTVFLLHKIEWRLFVLSLDHLVVLLSAFHFYLFSSTSFVSLLFSQFSFLQGRNIKSFNNHHHISYKI